MDPNILPSTIPEGAQLHSRSFARRPASRQKSSGWADMKSTLGEAAVPRSTLDGEWPSSRPSSRQSSRPSSRGGPSLSGDPGGSWPCPSAPLLLSFPRLLSLARLSIALGSPVCILQKHEIVFFFFFVRTRRDSRAPGHGGPRPRQPQGDDDDRTRAAAAGEGRVRVAHPTAGGIGERGCELLKYSGVLGTETARGCASASSSLSIVHVV